MTYLRQMKAPWEKGLMKREVSGEIILSFATNPDINKPEPGPSPTVRHGIRERGSRNFENCSMLAKGVPGSMGEKRNSYLLFLMEVTGMDGRLPAALAPNRAI